MDDEKFLRLLGEFSLEMAKRWPDLQSHAEKLGITADNLGEFGKATLALATDDTKTMTKQ
jgi:hypothetical protein